MAVEELSQPEQAGELIPVGLVEWQEEDGRVLLLRPRFSSGLLQKYLLPKLRPPHFRIHLDAHGSAAWKLCDGSRTLAEVGAALREQFGQQIEPVQERLALFVSQLCRHRLLKLQRVAEQA
ncbi:MAG: PqqD family protein [bacterium]|nr:PqqD family protein [candidate division KSB1 bacterium]MDH7561023.1 PqqD family protein [bacterium]